MLFGAMRCSGTIHLLFFDEDSERIPRYTFVTYLRLPRMPSLAAVCVCARPCALFCVFLVCDCQNDVQAMARCHRIGQTKSVMVYRLITRDWWVTFIRDTPPLEG